MSRLRAVLLATLLLTGCSGGDEEAPEPKDQQQGQQETARVFPDGTERDYSTPVKLLSFDPGRGSAVVEPIIFMHGRDYCAAFGVDPIDGRCAREVVVEDSNTRITLSLSEDLELFAAEQGGNVCLGDDGAGTCRVSEKAFTARVNAGGELSARLTVSDGEATRLAELYQP